MPSYIQKKHAHVNVQNFDDECFKWVILSRLHPVKGNAGRLSNCQRYKKELHFEGIAFPVMLKNVAKFEKQNDISVNVLILQKKKRRFIVAPIHITGDKQDMHVILCIIQNYYVDEEEPDEHVTNDDDKPICFHYVWIKDLSRLVSEQLSKSDHKHYICDRCLHYFHNEEKLMAYDVHCSKINECSVTLPSPGNETLKLKNFKMWRRCRLLFTPTLSVF